MTEDRITQYGPVSRRKFLRWAFGVSLLGLVGQAGLGIGDFLKPRIEPGSFGAKVPAGLVGEFGKGTVTHISSGRFYVSRFESGDVLAMSHRCTHLGCTVPWLEAEGRFRCPCHSSVFNTRGEVLEGPAPRPLDLFSVEIVDGEVVVDTGNRIERDRFSPDQATKTEV